MELALELAHSLARPMILPVLEPDPAENLVIEYWGFASSAFQHWLLLLPEKRRGLSASPLEHVQG